MQRPDDRPGGEALLDFGVLAGRLRKAAWAFGALAAVGVLVEVALGAAAGPAAVRWAAAGLALVVLAAAVLVALQAYRAADAVQRSGERLSRDDVGLGPPRRERR